MHAEAVCHLLDSIVAESLLNVGASNRRVRAVANPLLRLVTHALRREFLHHPLYAAMLHDEAGNQLKQWILSLAPAPERADDAIKKTHMFISGWFWVAFANWKAWTRLTAKEPWPDGSSLEPHRSTAGLRMANLENSH
jgi:hypothetical protein